MLYYIILYYINIIYIYYAYILYIYKYLIVCDLIILFFVGCSVIVGHHDILPCAATLKSLQGLGVRFYFLALINDNCKLLLITLFFNKYIYIY